MKIIELDYDPVPPELFAREPRELHGEPRSASRLLVMKRKTNEIEHTWFYNIGKYLNPGDLIVLNNSRTIKAQLYGWLDQKHRVNVRLVLKINDNTWQCTINPNHVVQSNSIIEFGSKGQLRATVLEKRHDLPLWIIQFSRKGRDLIGTLNKIGNPVVPSYTLKKFPLRYYQNVFSTVPGGAEQPSAGRHFTKSLMRKLKKRGIDFAYVTLHVGLSSVQPTRHDLNFEDLKMYEEAFEMDENCAEKINSVRENGGRIVACGTTVVRVLETVSNEKGYVKPMKGFTDLYIYPGYKWKIVDALISNFHGRRTTRLALVAAFAGKDLLIRAYNEAIKKGYKFFEFGDATLTI
jgi:S-adenosylmethionine:tRNA ribosyltransferase-isomerase